MSGQLRSLLMSGAMAFVGAGLIYPPCAAAQDRIAPLAGTWDREGTQLRIVIHDDSSVHHYKLGSGDIKHDNADYFVIRYRQHHFNCHYQVRKYSNDEIAFVVAVRPSEDDCELGVLRRVPQPADRQDKRAEVASDNEERKPSREKKYAGEQKAPIPLSSFRDCEDCPEMIVIPSGEFKMGSPKHERAHPKFEQPVRTVKVSAGFAVGRYPITLGEFDRFARETGQSMGTSCVVEAGGRLEEREGLTFRSPGFQQSLDHPVVCVSWQEAQRYVAWLSKKTKRSYRLLSEAEREYVSRASTTTAYWWGNRVDPNRARYHQRSQRPENLPKEARAFGKPGSRQAAKGTVAVDRYNSNPWGLFQVHGNSADWVQDCWNATYDTGNSSSTARLVGDCSRRVQRGGGWSDWAKDIRSGYRWAGVATQRFNRVGFRVAASLKSGTVQQRTEPK